MSNKKVVETYMEGFREGDHARILSCLTEDVIWEMPGYFYHLGKEAFDREIENEAFVGLPKITVTRHIEEGDIVVSEGTVTAGMRNGGTLDAVFCDVFHFEGDKIKKLTSYLMQRNLSPSS
jgi:uncharacterized protein